MGFGAGQIVYQDDLDDIQPTYKSKAGSTTRTNTTTMADDPDLSAISLDPGTYEVEFTLFYTVTGSGMTANTPRFKTRWAFSGSWSGSMRSAHGPGIVSVATDPSQVVTTTFRGVDATTQDSVYNAGSTTAYSSAEEKGFITVTATGNLSLQWAQHVANATANVNLQPGSYVKITKIVA